MPNPTGLELGPSQAQLATRPIELKSGFTSRVRVSSNYEYPIHQGASLPLEYDFPS
jgi:hypothetical protein